MLDKRKSNKRLLIIIIIFLLLLILALSLVYFKGKEDSWVCENGQWVKHGNPTEPMPDYPCGTEEPAESENIRVFSPKFNEEISSSLEISGEAKGFWYFEGDFPVELVDDSGNIIAPGFVTAQDEWMTEDFVEFKAVLDFKPGQAKSGKLIFRRDNPSDLPENDEEFVVPVRFKQAEKVAEKMTVKVFFTNVNYDPEVTCEKVFPVEREIEPTLAVAKAAIEELLNGPTEIEKGNKYLTSINQGVTLNSIRIEDSTAYVDFDSQLENQVGGSCRVSLIRKQIEETLKQFPTINNVVISIEGRTEDILQP